MDNPTSEVEGVIRSLTQTSPSEQRKAIKKYFTPNASFTHPFCRTGTFDGSRFLIRAIYRWYKIMSPHIELDVNSIAYDDSNLVLYVNISQVFRIWLIPFYEAPVNLTTVLRLQHDRASNKYFITSQDDLYQVNEFVKFVAPGGQILVWAWQFVATIVCFFAALAFWPISLWEERNDSTQESLMSQSQPEKGLVAVTRASEKLVTAPSVQQR